MKRGCATLCSEKGLAILLLLRNKPMRWIETRFDPREGGETERGGRADPFQNRKGSGTLATLHPGWIELRRQAGVFALRAPSRARTRQSAGITHRRRLSLGHLRQHTWEIQLATRRGWVLARVGYSSLSSLLFSRSVRCIDLQQRPGHPPS